jgi:hypothetical protein
MAQGPNVLVGYIHGSTVDSGFLDSLTMLLARDKFRRILDIAAVESGPYITDGRNMLGETLLDTKADWLLMLDCDMCFPYDLIRRLMHHATSSRVVGGLCFAYNGRARHALPVMFDSESGKRIMSWKPGSLVPVGFVGGACLLIHRNVFEKTPRPWFHDMTLPNGQHMDQDQVFCMNIRQAGFELVVDTSTVIGHGKRIFVDDRDYVMPEVIS